MALPSREFLIKQVDSNFALQHPEAPRQLNPNDPAQAHFVQAWRELYASELYWMVAQAARGVLPEGTAKEATIAWRSRRAMVTPTHCRTERRGARRLRFP